MTCLSVKVQRSVECLLLKPNWLQPVIRQCWYLDKITVSKIFDKIEVIAKLWVDNYPYFQGHLSKLSNG